MFSQLKIISKSQMKTLEIFLLVELMIAKQALDEDPKAKQQITFIGNIERAGNTIGIVRVF